MIGWCRNVAWVQVWVGCLVLVAWTGFGLWMVAHSSDLAPPEVEDLRVEPVLVEEHQNAYPLMVEALQLLKWPLTANQVKDYLKGDGLETEKIEEALNSNQACLDLIGKATRLEHCVRPDPPPSFDDQIPWMKELMDLRRLMRVSVRHERDAGRIPQAVDRCLVFLKTGQHLKQHPQSLVDYLIGLSYATDALEELVELVGDANVSESDLNKINRHLAGFERESVFLARALKQEYRVFGEMVSFMLHSMEQGARQGGMGLGDDMGLMRLLMTRRYLLHPNRTLHLAAPLYRHMVANADQPYGLVQPLDIEGVLDRGANPLLMIAKPNLVGRMLIATAVPVTTTGNRKRCEMDWRLISCRMRIALELHRRAHGAFPETLEALIGGDLKVVPVDPFDGKPLRYSLEKKILYSVGKDGRDSGGEEDDLVLKLPSPPS